MEANTTEGVVDCHALPEIKPFRPFAKFREKYQQLEKAVESARKRGEQLRESITPISARTASRAGSAASGKAAPKPSSNKRVNTLRRMTAEAARRRKADRPAARNTNAAPAQTRRQARKTAQSRHSDKPAASRKTAGTPQTDKRVAKTTKPSSPSGNSDRSASSASTTDSVKNGKA